MTDEEVVRSEAREAFDYWNIEGERNIENVVLQMQKQVRRFYSPADKAIFLDEVKGLISKQVENHKKRCTYGPGCPSEALLHKVLFFIKQEIDQLPQIIHENAISNAQRDTVFISYSHFDKPYLNIIKRHFKPLEKHIEFWEDSQIVPGQKWEDEIKAAMGRAKVALLLVSADFFNSEFITKKEIPPLLEAADKDGATILFLVLKPCLLDEYPQIKQYQGVNAPSNPFIRMSEADQEDLCVSLATTIRSHLLVG